MRGAVMELTGGGIGRSGFFTTCRRIYVFRKKLERSSLDFLLIFVSGKTKRIVVLGTITSRETITMSTREIYLDESTQPSRKKHNLSRSRDRFVVPGAAR